MKKLLVLVSVSLFVACMQEQTNDVVSTSVERKEAVEAENLGLAIDEFKSMPDELKERRRMGLLLSLYVELDSVNHCYRLNITKEEAVKLGVTEKEYGLRIEEIEETNKLIKETMAKGIPVHFTDVKKEAEKFFQAHE